MMNAWRIVMSTGLSLLLVLAVLAGCSGTDGQLAGPATVRLLLADSRATTPPSLSSLVFTGVDLLSATSSPTAPSVMDWSLTSGLVNPDFPIPLLGSPSTIPQYDGNPAGATQVLSGIVPPGTYQTIRMELDPTFAGVLNELPLPFQPATMQALIPIVGGMRLDPNDSVTLLIDLFTKQAHILE